MKLKHKILLFTLLAAILSGFAPTSQAQEIDTIFYNKHITMIFPDDHIEYYHYDQNGNKIIDSFNNGKFSYNYRLIPGKKEIYLESMIFENQGIKYFCDTFPVYFPEIFPAVYDTFRTCEIALSMQCFNEEKWYDRDNLSNRFRIICNDSEYLEDKGYNSLAIEMFSLYGTGDNTKVTRKYGNSCSIDLFETIMNKEYYTQEWLPSQSQTKKMWKIMTDIMKMPKDFCRTEEPKFMIEIVCDGNYFYLPVSGCWGLGEDTKHNERWHDKHQNKYLKQMKQMLTFIRSKCEGN